MSLVSSQNGTTNWSHLYSISSAFVVSSLFHINRTTAIHLSTMTNFWVSCGCAQHSKTAAMTKLNFQHVHFPCDSIAILWWCRIATRQARLLLETQSVRTTKQGLALTHFACKCRKTAVRLLWNELACYCTAAARMPRTVRQLIKFAWLSHGWTYDSLAILQAHLTCAWTQDNRTSIVCLPYVKWKSTWGMQFCLQSAAWQWCLR